MGELPDWYITIRAARYLKVPPWELAGQSVAWTNYALAAQSAENAAEAGETDKWTSQMQGASRPGFPGRR